MDNLTLIMLTLFLICAGLIIGILNFVQSKNNTKYKKTSEQLEIEKNKLATSPIGPELAKEIVREFLTNKFEGGRHQTRVDKMMSFEG